MRTRHATFGSLLSIGSIHCEDEFCASIKGRMGGGEMGKFSHEVLRTRQLSWFIVIGTGWVI